MMYGLSVLILIGCLLWPAAGRAGESGETTPSVKKVKLSQAAAIWVGESKYDNAAISIASAGDVNGDGYDDILIGAYNNDEGGSNAGKAYLIWGRGQEWPKEINLFEADVAFVGEAEFDNAGRPVAYAGDVNGDGLADFLIGAQNNDERGDNAGKAYLFFGKKQGWRRRVLLSQADVFFYGERSEDNAGSGLSYLGDVNGDGFDDFAIGARNNADGGEEGGKCYLMFGKAEGWDKKIKLSNADASFISEDKTDRIGDVISYAGDVNGDGFDDFLLGAPEKSANGMESGQVYLILGRPGGFIRNLNLGKVDASFVGEKRGDKAGGAVSFIGDVNNDGLSDFIIGAENNSEVGRAAGKCYVFFGRRRGWRKKTPLHEADVFLYGENKRDHFGSAVAYSGDLEGWGRESFLVSANRNDESARKAGKVYLVKSRAEWPKLLRAAEIPLAFLGEKKNDYAGNRLSYGGDVNGDGLPDVLIGADTGSRGGRQAGQAYLVTGQVNKPPRVIKSVVFKRDNTYTQDLTSDVGIGDWLYLEARGEDLQPERRNLARVRVAAGKGRSLKVSLMETAPASGVYRGRFQLVGTSCNELTRKLAIKAGERVSVFVKGVEEPLAEVSLRVGVDDYIVDDDMSGESFGNGNEHIEAGESIELGLVLLNYYFRDLRGVSGRLSSDDSNVTILKRELEFGDMASRSRRASRNKALLRVAAACRVGHVLKLKLALKTKDGLRWDNDIELHVEKVITVSGKIAVGESGLPLPGAAVKVQEKKKKKAAKVSQNGEYRLYLPEGDYDEMLYVTAPGCLSLKREVNCAQDRKLDFSLTPRQNLGKAPVVFSGERTYDFLGDSLAWAGDVNGDGYDDFLIGAWGNDEGGVEAGKVYLIFGRPGGWERVFNANRADASFVGEVTFDEAGRCLSSAGDVNGDGFADFLIGAPKNDAGGDKTGQTYLLLGKPDGWKKDTPLSEADASFIGEGNHDRSGSALSYAGDVNGDGFGDFLIGAWANDGNGYDTGSVYLIFGKAENWQKRTSLSSADASWVGEFPRDEAGKAVAYAGDVNGDGYDDFLIGAPAYTTPSKDFVGKTYLILGRQFGWNWRVNLGQGADASFVGEDNNDSSGSSIGYVGDVNGDGMADFAIGAWSSDAHLIDAGQVYLFFGSRDLWGREQSLATASASFLGEGVGDAAGISLSMAGDVNGDGYGDFLVGAWRNKFHKKESGQSYLVLGKPRGWEMKTGLAFADASYYGKGEGDASGRAVTYAGDVNGDGYDDFLVGAKGEDSKGLDAGEAYLLMAAQNKPPKAVAAISVVSSMVCDNNPEEERRRYWQELEVELAGIDGDPKGVNVAQAFLTSTSHNTMFKLRLRETEVNSAVYRGRVKVMSTSNNFFENRFLAYGTAEVVITAQQDASVYQKVRIEDVLPPFITDIHPAPNTQRAPIASRIRFQLRDLGSGVDSGGIELWVNDKPVSPRVGSIDKGYLVSYDPEEHFAFAQPVRVRVKAPDLSEPVHVLDTSYSFQTVDAGALLNPGFEEDFAHWSHRDESGAITIVDSNIAHSGNNSARIDFTGRQDLRYLNLSQGPVPVEPNTKYLLKAYVKTEGISSLSGVRIYVEGASQSGRVVASDPGYFQEESGAMWDTSDWTELTVAFTATEHTRYIYVYVARWTGGDLIIGKCWVDDFYLMDESEAGFGWKRFFGTLKEYFR